jgi:Ni/Co efflux regulator RcnB
MKKMLLAALLSTFAATAFAQDATSTCQSQASDKKLAGAALKSFMTKCQRDATTSCTSQASDKKLAGAAKSSFTNKCVRDAVGT